jgi:spore coat protein H
VLTSTFDDKAVVRQRMVYEMWTALGERTDPLLPREHVRIDSSNVVVYVNDVYEGLYTIVDHVDRDRFGDSLDIDDQGNLYKAVNHDANFNTMLSSGGNKDDLLAGYETRDEPRMPVAQLSDLRSLIEFVATSSSDDFDANIASKIDLDDVMDWWALVAAVDAGDSAGKNSYLYFSPTEQLFRCAPWDFNHSFGQAWETSHTSPTGNLPAYESAPNQLFARLLTSTVHGPVMRARIAAHIADGRLGTAAVAARFDALITKVRPSALRDERVWDGPYREFYAATFGKGEFTTFEEEAIYTRAWILARFDHLDTRY